MKSLRNSLFALLLVVSLAPAQTVEEAGSETYLKIREAGKNLKCQCSCSYTIADCNMLYCHYREEVKPEIKKNDTNAIRPRPKIPPCKLIDPLSL